MSLNSLTARNIRYGTKTAADYAEETGHSCVNLASAGYVFGSLHIKENYPVS